MDPYRRDRNKKKRNPYDFFGFDDDFFDDMFNDRFFDDFKRMTEEMFRMLSNAQPGHSYVHGYNVRVGPDGKPRISEFGNHPVQSDKGKSLISEEREPLTDVMEGEKEVTITVEIPGVEKQDIDLRATENELEIRVNTPQRKYQKIVDLPVEVKPKTTKATYKNGILDVVIKRKEQKKDEDTSYRVNIN